jgi:GGDEF domain-containing protein
MAATPPEASPHEKKFWVRLTATMLLAAFPLAWLLVVERRSPVWVGAAAFAMAIALLVVWDTTRWLPAGLVFWARPKAMRDEVTKLYNPAAWRDLLEAEEGRAARHGQPVGVVVVRTDPGPDAARADAEVGAAISRTVRGHDVAARLQDGAFAVLAVGSDQDGCDALVGRLTEQLSRVGAAARFGAVARTEGRTLQQVWAEADRASSGDPATRTV